MPSLKEELAAIQTIAAQVRSCVKRWVKNDPCIDYKDLMGACAIASYTLWKALKVLGYEKANLVCVSTIDYGHCWVEYRGYVIDITATQFAGPEIAVFQRRKAPSWFKTETWGRRRWNEHAVEEVHKWGAHGPHLYEKKTSSLIKRLEERETQCLPLVNSRSPN